MCIFTISLGFQLHIMISTKMCSLFIAYKGPNNARQTALKEAACSHFLFSILLFAAQSNMFLQPFWIFQTVNCPQLYFLREPCNFFVKNSSITPFTCTKTFFPSPHRKHPKLCKNGRSSVRETFWLFSPCSSPAKQEVGLIFSLLPCLQLHHCKHKIVLCCFPYPLPFPLSLSSSRS